MPRFELAPTDPMAAAAPPRLSWGVLARPSDSTLSSLRALLPSERLQELEELVWGPSGDGEGAPALLGPGERARGGGGRPLGGSHPPSDGPVHVHGPSLPPPAARAVRLAAALLEALEASEKKTKSATEDATASSSHLEDETAVRRHLTEQNEALSAELASVRAELHQSQQTCRRLRREVRQSHSDLKLLLRRVGGPTERPSAAFAVLPDGEARGRDRSSFVAHPHGDRLHDESDPGRRPSEESPHRPRPLDPSPPHGPKLPHGSAPAPSSLEPVLDEELEELLAALPSHRGRVCLP